MLPGDFDFYPPDRCFEPGDDWEARFPLASLDLGVQGIPSVVPLN